GGGLAALEVAPVAGDAPERRAAESAGGPSRVASGGAPRRDAGSAAPAPLAFDVGLAADDRERGPIGPTPERSRGQWDKTPYQSRTGERKIAALEEFGGTVETERAVELGLEYLASRQRQDGRWGRRDRDEKYGETMIGKTGLAVLAFMGAGHTAASGSRYSKVVERGLLFLVDQQDDETGHIGSCSSYGHAIATYALGEAYALTKDERLRRTLENAVQQIVDNQLASRDPLLDGGWSYFYPSGRRFDRWPRASVTAWQVMALESAKLGGVSVPKHVFDRARSFLVNCWDPSRGAFRYSHDPSRLRSDYDILPGSTPASMFALSLLGGDLTQDQFGPARRFVLERAPSGYRYTGDDDFVFRARGNLYFWYYGTLAMFRVGGDEWERWNVAMKDTLVPAQAEDGSWRPISIYAEFADDTERDRVYTTAMNVLALEVYYRYFTPLLKVD
ncbi:MAG: prenyltransferase/squalene oxidase repeat-containing protein, partial [Planctomycetota bacterium]